MTAARECDAGWGGWVGAGCRCVAAAVRAPQTHEEWHGGTTKWHAGAEEMLATGMYAARRSLARNLSDWDGPFTRAVVCAFPPVRAHLRRPRLPGRVASVAMWSWR
eukprot:1046027-Prymnesium_polylepis.1